MREADVLIALLIVGMSVGAAVHFIAGMPAWGLFHLSLAMGFAWLLDKAR